MRHVSFLKGAYLADITSKAENDFIKDVLPTLHAKEGTDYLIGGMDVIINKQFVWTSGKLSYYVYKIRAKILCLKVSAKVFMP